MAETPFSPESGAPGQASEPGIEGGAPQPVVEDGAPEAAPPAPPAEAEGSGGAGADGPGDVASVDQPSQSSRSAPAETPVPAAPAGMASQQPEPTAPGAEPGSGWSATVHPADPTPEPPGVAATISVPPLDPADGDTAGGGEWQMLVTGIGNWWESGEAGRQWQRVRGPLKGVAILVLVLLTLRLYATVVSAIDAIPLVSGLLELTGLIAVLQFSYSRLLRTSDREQVLDQWRRRWLDFRGRD